MLLAGNSFLPDETDVGTLAPALENAILDASDGEGASKLNFTRLNENIGQLSEVRYGGREKEPGCIVVGGCAWSGAGGAGVFLRGRFRPTPRLELVSWWVVFARGTQHHISADSNPAILTVIARVCCPGATYVE